MSDRQLLRVVELKGRLRPEDAAPVFGVDAERAAELLADLVERGWCVNAGPAYRVSEAGRQLLADSLEAERAEVDATALSNAYDAFCGFNGSLKEIITAWQMRDPQTPNDHTDAAYDADVLGRLAALHTAVAPLAQRLGTIAPRLSSYAARLQGAQDRIAAGDHIWVARPVIDSYHTVWFELHEDLIQLSGLTRAEEAAAGRAH